MRLRNDLLPENAPEGLEVFQLTEEALPSSHVYMEAQIFTPDSKRLLVHRSAHPHGSDQNDPEHRYLVCDLDNGGALSPITHETGATAPSLSPDGEVCYYFVNETKLNGGTLTLKRVRMDGTERETILVVDQPPQGAKCRPSRIYPLSTISPDGQRLSTAAFLGDGTEEAIRWGLLVFDLEQATVEVVLEGPTWCNLHPQYCRATNTDSAHDIMVQDNHGNECAPNGSVSKLVGGDGADIHLIRDDGANFRSFPWGRDGTEFCQGHQCWQGTGIAAITSTSVRGAGICELVAGEAVASGGHQGLATPGGQRNVLSRRFDDPRFSHFATDAAAKRFISDARTRDGQWHLYAAEFALDEMGEVLDWTFVLDTQSSNRAHPHPFLSPDGKVGFFNSDESGVLQAYMVRGWEG